MTDVIIFESCLGLLAALLGLIAYLLARKRWTTRETTQEEEDLWWWSIR